MIEPIAALEARLADARLRIDRDEDRLAQLEAALDAIHIVAVNDKSGCPRCAEIVERCHALETPAEPITVLRECWNCGHDHDADQDIKFCHSCGAANPNSVGPQSKAETDCDDAPENLEGFDKPGGVFKIGGKEVTREEGLAAFKSKIKDE